MASKYNLRSRDKNGSSAYAALPGTTQLDFIPHNMTDMKALVKDIVGCHPSRWIYELINNDFTGCDLFHRARRAKLNSHYGWEHPHRLVFNGNQSFSTSSSRLLSSICLDCNFHFIFKISWDEAQSDLLCSHDQTSWPLRDDQFPWHHLSWVGSDSDPNVTRDQTKYYPLLARENFVCTAPPCTFQLTLEVSEPRMASCWVDLLLDSETITQQLASARQEDPSRYEGATNDWATQAPSTLNTYLKNVLEAPPSAARTISKRNKRFAVLFGPRCFLIFRQLEFRESIDLVDGLDEGSFTPVVPMPSGGPSGTTETGTYRAYLEDVRAEIQNLIHKAGQSPESPTFLTPVLHADLGCREVPDIGSNPLVNEDRYRLIGVLPTQPREIVVNAYKRQWQIIAARRRDLVDALLSIANDSGDERLSDYAITQSSVFENQLQRHGSDDEFGVVAQALTFLGLSPPNTYTADKIIRAFRLKLARDPADATTARNMLMAIAEASNDDSYQTKLLMEVDVKMSLETAKTVLGLDDAEAPWQTIVKTTKAKLDSQPLKEGKSLYLDALDSISEHTSSALLKQSVMELRHAHSINGPSLGSSEDVIKAVNLDLPVGLHNIGNTCYLNSLLQYLFTVKPIRDIVFNYEDLRLDLTDESIYSRRLGGNKMQMDRGEAVVAQAFAQELAILFKNLRSSDQAASRPSQRLANAVLLSTHTLLTSTKQTPDQLPGQKPPPLPERPSPAPPYLVSGDVDMGNVNVSVKPLSDSVESASTTSTQTLVDHEMRSDQVYDQVDAAEADVGSNEPNEHPSPVVDIPAGSDMDTTMHDAREVIYLGDTAEPLGLGGDAARPGRDTDMMDDGRLETVDQKVLNALEYQKRSSGTDQQDVEEVMGSIINRLQAAIRPSCIDIKTGIQYEKIMETFFVTTVNYTRKFDEREYQHEISFDRSITAFPAAEGPCSLYDALGRNFDQQILEDSKLSRYTAIKTLPPVLHILIQRSQSFNSKNGNPVVIPETLYLDRYIDAPHDSLLFRRRVEAWTIAERIADIKSFLASVEPDPAYFNYLESYRNEFPQYPDQPYSNGYANGGSVSPLNLNGAPVASTSPPMVVEEEDEEEENWDFDGPVEDDFMLVQPEKTVDAVNLEPMLRVTGLRETYGALRERMVIELRERQAALEELLSRQKQVPYRLHAVICHRGHLTSGHYWVWIHDFEANLWRWYNDADVREVKDTAEVLRDLSSSGEPYFLCYVRDSDKEKYVSVLGRQIPKKEEQEQEQEQVSEMATPEFEVLNGRSVSGDTSVGTSEPSERSSSGEKESQASASEANELSDLHL